MGSEIWIERKIDNFSGIDYIFKQRGISASAEDVLLVSHFRLKFDPFIEFISIRYKNRDDRTVERIHITLQEYWSVRVNA